MRISFDKEADAAYIRLADPVSRPVKTVPVEGALPAMINLDFDRDGTLFGIEVLDASRVLPTSFLTEYANRGVVGHPDACR